MSVIHLTPVDDSMSSEAELYVFTGPKIKTNQAANAALKTAIGEYSKSLHL